ncbi:MAG TPA: glycine cleavage T C-terminal barrel domain-containing protein, partial [Candidatus Kapabacteria bacterium]
NEITALEKGSGAVLTALLNEKGRFIDVLKVVKADAGETLLIVSKDKEQAIISWLDKFTIMEDARFVAATEQTSQFLLCGPKAQSILAKYTSQDLNDAPRTKAFNLSIGLSIGATSATLVKAPSLAGEGWFILCAKEKSVEVWNELLREVEKDGGARFEDDLFEVLRIENGTPIAPNEINEKHNPLELPLAKEAVSFTKGCYIGQEVIARLDAQNKVQRTLVGLKFKGTMPHAGDRMVDESLPSNTPLGNEIGEVTSIMQSPEFGTIGLGYVRGKYANPESELSVKGSEGNLLPVTIVHLPFHA